MIPIAEAHAKGICVNCQRLAAAVTELGWREWLISGLCEKCFDEFTKEDEAPDEAPE